MFPRRSRSGTSTGIVMHHWDQTTDFASLLRHCRRAARLTQEELASHAGVSERTISDLERRVITKPQRGTAERLADALGLSDAQRRAFISASRVAWTEPRIVTEPVLAPQRVHSVRAPGLIVPRMAIRSLIDRRQGSGWAVLSALFAVAVTALTGYLFVIRQSAPTELSLSVRPIAVWTGSAHALQLRSPSAVAVDNRGNVYVADTGDNRIVELSPGGRPLRVLGGAGSGPGQLRQPSGVAVDNLGNVYVADTGNDRFQIFSSKGTPSGEWTRFHQVSPSATYGRSHALTVSPAGRVYVAAVSYVGEIDASSGDEVALYGASHFVFGNEVAGGIAVDAHNNVYLTVPATGMVYKFGEHAGWDPNGPLLARWGGQPDSPAGLEHPLGIALDRHQNVYVADAARGRIQIYTSSGRWRASWPKQGEHLFLRPSGIAVDSTGNVYVADSGMNRVLKLSPSGHLLARWGDNTELPGVTDPSKLTVDSRGDVYAIVQGGNSIASISSHGRLRALWRASAWTGAGATSLTDIATSPRGYLYVADALHGRVLELSRAGTRLRTHDGVTRSQQLGGPSSVAVDSQGDLYVLDSSTGDILKFLPTGASVPWWASDGDPTVLSSPQALAVDSYGRTYVIDHGLFQVHAFARDGTPLARWGEHATRSGAFEAPADVAVDGRGRVYVIDAQLNRLSVFTSRGLLLTSIGAAGRRPGEFWHPTGVALDGAGGVYVADTGNDRIEKFEVKG